MNDHTMSRRSFFRESAVASGVGLGTAMVADPLAGAQVTDVATERQDDAGVVYHKDIHKSDLMEGFPPPRDKRVSIANWFATTDTIRWTHLNSERVFQSAVIEKQDAPTWVLPRKMIDPERLAQATVLWGNTRDEALSSNSRVTVAEWLDRSETDAFLILHDGHIIAEQYFGKATPSTRHHLWSASRSYLATVVAAFLDGPLGRNSQVVDYVAELQETGFRGATLQQLLDQTTSLDYSEFPDPDGFDKLPPAAQNAQIWGTAEFTQANHVGAQLWRIARVFDALPTDPPGGIYDYVTTLTGDGKHGELFGYRDANSMALQWSLERATGIPYLQHLGELWRRLGPEYDATISLDRVGTPGGGFGLAVTARDWARFGQMLCNRGIAGTGLEIPGAKKMVDDVLCTPGLFSKSSPYGYRNHFWTRVPWNQREPQLTAFGGYQQKCIIDPTQRTVVVWLASFWNRAPDKISPDISGFIDLGLESFLDDTLPEIIG